MNQTSNPPASILIAIMRIALSIMLLALLNPSTQAANQVDGFDHFTTGFPLTGKHEFIDCSSCHIGGQFKGTPMECVLCHNNSRAPGKHAEHVASSNICDDCHTTKTWRGARFDHIGIFSPCDTCHNNSTLQGCLRRISL